MQAKGERGFKAAINMQDTAILQHITEAIFDFEMEKLTIIVIRVMSTYETLRLFLRCLEH